MQRCRNRCLSLASSCTADTAAAAARPTHIEGEPLLSPMGVAAPEGSEAWLRSRKETIAYPAATWSKNRVGRRSQRRRVPAILPLLMGHERDSNHVVGNQIWPPPPECWEESKRLEAIGGRWSFLVSVSVKRPTKRDGQQRGG